MFQNYGSSVSYGVIRDIKLDHYMQVDLSVIISSYERRDRIMNENLIVEDNTIYEIDPECLKKKREREARKKSEEKLKNDAEYRKNQR